LTKNAALAEPGFAPVFSEHGCVGHVIRSVRGWTGYDSEDRKIGIYPTPDAAAQALLEAAVVDAAE